MRFIARDKVLCAPRPNPKTPDDNEVVGRFIVVRLRHKVLCLRDLTARADEDIPVAAIEQTRNHDLATAAAGVNE